MKRDHVVIAGSIETGEGGRLLHLFTPDDNSEDGFCRRYVMTKPQARWVREQISYNDRGYVNIRQIADEDRDAPQWADQPLAGGGLPAYYVIVDDELDMGTPRPV
jgi:hypothetical protein